MLALTTTPPLPYHNPLTTTSIPLNQPTQAAPPELYYAPKLTQHAHKVHHSLHTLQKASRNTIRRNQARKRNPHVLPGPRTLNLINRSPDIPCNLGFNEGGILVVVDGCEDGDADDAAKGSAGHGECGGCGD